MQSMPLTSPSPAPAASDNTLADRSIRLTDHDTYYVICAELPHLEKQQICVSVDGSCVTLAAAADVRSAQVSHSDNPDIQLIHRFQLQQPVDSIKAQATLACGKLTVVLPKSTPISRRLLVN